MGRKFLWTLSIFLLFSIGLDDANTKVCSLLQKETKWKRKKWRNTSSATTLWVDAQVRLMRSPSMHREIALGISADYKLDYLDTLLKWWDKLQFIKCALKPLIWRDGMGIGYRLYVVQAPRDCLRNVVAFCRIIRSDSMEVEKTYIGKKNLHW